MPSKTKPLGSDQTVTGEYTLQRIDLKGAANGYVIEAAYVRPKGKRAGYKTKTFVEVSQDAAVSRVNALLNGITD